MIAVIRSCIRSGCLPRMSYRVECRAVSTSSFKGQWDFKLGKVPYNGISIDLVHTPKDVTPRDVANKLKDCIVQCKNNGNRAMWVKVPVDKSYLIPVVFKHGFTYHHAEGNHAMLLKWLPDNVECKVPPYASHQIGVAGIVVNEEENKVLVVQDRQKYKMGVLKKPIWKFPGGLSDEGEDIGHTAVREVFEETGIKSEFQSIVLFRQQHKMRSAFNKSDIFVVVLAALLSGCQATAKPTQKLFESCTYDDSH
ncbi:nucleoside diphosphate-linked moiety X motif 6 isoform X2 [Nematostella vectensis]|uniref:nucleoside diphosphate-linked moiety X motif 6 isoform X2 n=1 Tax=Nematostella vectensis TaxID=45351 RepID=UPI0020774E96|nr:nucleoside diphosphate-linked moiety X motif 6 isoform X2 [Nematostella vectensis]